MAELKENINILNPSYDCYIHILRHFSRLSSRFVKKIKNIYNYSDSDISKMLRIPASKFYYRFAKDPEELWKKISEKIAAQKYVLRKVKNKYEFNIKFDKSLYTAGIGSDSVVPISILGTEEKKKIKIVRRDNLSVNILKLNKFIPTWQVNMIGIADNDKIEIITIFPGRFMPPIQSEDQNAEENLRNRKIWNRFAIVNFKKKCKYFRNLVSYDTIYKRVVTIFMFINGWCKNTYPEF